MAQEVTVGLDVGTTSVKAVAVDGDGRVLARARVPHTLWATRPGELAHDADEAWRRGVVLALDQLGREPGAGGRGLTVRAVNVAAMVPSMCAVDRSGRPVSPGLLYGDERGVGTDAVVDEQIGEMGGFLRWLVDHHPDAAGYWPAQAVANAALADAGGSRRSAAIDTAVAFTSGPLFDREGWDARVAATAGLDDVGRLPAIVVGGEPVGRVERAGGALLGPGTIDAFGEQLVAGADRPGDVLVILGSTLIVWVVTREWTEADGLWTVPHSVPGMVLVGGPSNAGGLFLDWVARALGADLWSPGPAVTDPGRVPVWQPYLRGERVPFHDRGRRASLHDLDIGMGRPELVRAAFEASAFAVRHIVELSGVEAHRVVATGGGIRNGAWLEALADGTGLPVDPAEVSEGAARGAAWLARQTAGLEPPGADAGRWARHGERVEPDGRRAAGVEDRYGRFRQLVG